MAMFHTDVLDEQIKALPTVDTASGSVANFTTDMQENLVKCICEVASGSDSVSVFVNSINQWDEQWESGAFDFSTGAKVGNSSTIRSKNYIPCKPSTSYYNNNTSGHTYIFFYDMTKTFISYGDYKNMVFTTPSNAYYMMFYKSSGYGTTYNNDITINYPSNDTTYHAFNGCIIDLSETLSNNGSLDVLSGILTRSDDTTKQLSANYIQTLNGLNNIWCDTGDTSVKFIMSVGEYVNQNV